MEITEVFREARLELDSGSGTDDVISDINRVARPNTKLGPSEVVVRVMYVTSGKVNARGGAFARDEMLRLCDLIPGSPVMTGHDKSKLPIARCFRAKLVNRGGEDWVKVWFYWLSTTGGAEDLKRNIDGGIYSECSLGFNFKFPECSICGGDIRRCSHLIGKEYTNPSGSRTKCHFLYRGVSRVNEISLVYRGAVPGTAIANQILCNSEHDLPNSELVMRGVKVVNNLRHSAKPDSNDDSLLHHASSQSRFRIDAICGGGAMLTLESGTRSKCYLFPNFNSKLVTTGRLLAGYEDTSHDHARPVSEIDNGELVRTGCDDQGGTRFLMQGRVFSGEFALRPALIRSENITLFYKIEDTISGPTVS